MPATVFWDGDGGGSDWNNPLNWDTDALPAAADDVSLGSATVVHSYGSTAVHSVEGSGSFTLSGGSFSIAANSGMTAAGQFIFSNGLFTGAGDFASLGTMTWSGGTMQGTGFTIAAGALSITGATGNMRLDERVLVHQSTATWTGGTVYIDNGSAFATINAAATLDVQANVAFARWSGIGDAVYQNKGTFVKTSGAGVTTVGVAYSDEGVGIARANVGEIHFNGGGLVKKTLRADAGAVIAINGGELVLNTGAEGIGAGAFRLGGSGVLNVADDCTFTRLEQFNGEIKGAGGLFTTGTFDWYGGFMSGAGRTEANGGLSIHPSGIHRRLIGRLLATSAYGIWDGGDVWIDNGSNLAIRSGGILDIRTNANFARWDGVGTATVYVQGALRKTTLAGANLIGVETVATGTVDAQIGTIAFANGGIFDGNVNADANAVVAFGGGTFYWQNSMAGTGAGSIDIGSATVDVAGNCSAWVVRQFDGTVTGSANLQVLGKYKWFGGFMTGAGETRCDGGLDITNSAFNRRLYGRILKTNGPGVWDSGIVWADNGSQFVIEQNGVLDVQTSDDFTRWEAPVNATLTVIGTLRHSINAGDTGIFVTFNNSGLVQSLSGSFSTWVGGTNTGAFNAAAGAAIIVWGGNYSFQTGASCTGVGNFIVRDGSLSIDAAATATFVVQEGGTVTGSANWTVTGGYDWHGGFMTGSGETRCDGGLDISNSAINRRLYGRILKTNGPGVWDSGIVWADNGSQFVIEQNGVLDVQTSDDFTRWEAPVNATLTVIGTLRHSVNAGDTGIFVTFNNSGLVQCLSGSFSSWVGGTNTGAFNAAFGAANIVWEGAYTFQTGAQATGAGRLILRGGSLSIDANAVAANFSHEDGTLTGAADLTVTGNYTWSGGFLSGSGQTIAVGTMTLPAQTANRRMYGRTLVNNGVATWTNHWAWMDNGSVIVNGPTGTMEILSDDTRLNRWDGVGTAMFVNQGLLKKTAAGGQTQINVDFATSGVLQVNAGLSIYFGGNFVQTGGTSLINGNIDPAGAAQIQGGTLTGNGIVYAPVVVTGAGGIGPGNSPGQLTIEGDLSMSAGTTLTIELDGTTPGTQYDRLVVHGAVNLGGATLMGTRGFTPTIGTAFDMIDNDSTDAVAGTFAGIAQSDSITIGGMGFSVSYVGGDGNDVVLTAVSAGDSTAPTVEAVYFDGASWSTAFRGAAGNVTYGYPAQTGAGQLTSMPWNTLNAVYVKFSENVVVSSGSLSVRGINVANYSIASFGYDNVNYVAKWTFAAAFDTDRVLLDLDGDGGSAVADAAGNKLAGGWTEASSTFPSTGPAATDFKFRFVVAVGDADRNGLVRNADLNAVRNNLFNDLPSGSFSIFADIDGNGLVRNADLNAVRNHLFIDPPPGPGPNRSSSLGRLPDRGTRANARPASLYAATRFDASLLATIAPRRPAAFVAHNALDSLFSE